MPSSSTPIDTSSSGRTFAGAINSSPKLAILALTLIAPHAGELATAAARLTQIPGLRIAVLGGLGLVAAIGCGALLAVALAMLLTRLVGGAFPDHAEGLELVAEWQRAGVAPLRPTPQTVSAGRLYAPRAVRHHQAARRPSLSGMA
jgi:hypothetical protein